MRLWAPLAALGAMLAWAITSAVQAWGGHVGYSLDDAYIHMSMAKHLATRGVFGITPYEFSSSSSSPGWTLLIAGTYALFGVNEAAPLNWNVVFAVATVCLTYWWARRSGFSHWSAAAISGAVALGTPFSFLAVEGMEHCLQVFLVLLFACCLTEWREGRMRFGWVCAAALLVGGIRMEGLFLVGTAAIMLLISQQARFAILLVGISLIPWTAYGAVAMRFGWPPLPISVLLKSLVTGTSGVTPRTLLSAEAVGTLYLLVPALTLLLYLLFGGEPKALGEGPPTHDGRSYVQLAPGKPNANEGTNRPEAKRTAPRHRVSRCWRNLRTPSSASTLASLVVVVALLQTFAAPRFGGLWDLRYQSYVVALAIVALAFCLRDSMPAPVSEVDVRSSGPEPMKLVLGSVLLFAVFVAIDSAVAVRGALWLPEAVLAVGLLLAGLNCLEAGPFRLLPVLGLASALGAASLFGAFGDQAAVDLLLLASGSGCIAVYGYGLVRRFPGVQKLVLRAPVALSPLTVYLVFSWSFSYQARVGNAAQNIHDQQGQIAQFLKMNYEGQSVAMNDIGAVNYFTDLHSLDLVGLGSLEVADDRLAGAFSRQAVDDLTKAHGCRIAFVFETWFGSHLPVAWKKVETWTISRNIICGDQTVTFFATDPSETMRLARLLHAYESMLPKSVSVHREPDEALAAMESAIYAAHARATGNGSTQR